MKLFNISIFSLLFFIMLFACDDGSGTYTGDGSGVCYLQTEDYYSSDEAGELIYKGEKKSKWKDGILISSFRANTLFYNEKGYIIYVGDSNGVKVGEYIYLEDKVEYYFNKELWLVYIHSNGKLDSLWMDSGEGSYLTEKYSYNNNEINFVQRYYNSFNSKLTINSTRYYNFDNEKLAGLGFAGLPFTAFTHNSNNYDRTYIEINNKNGDTLNYNETNIKISYIYNSNGYVTEKLVKHSSSESSKTLYTYDCK